MPVAVIVLAAGQGTRMNSDLPKVLHPLAGAPLVAHALATARALAPERTILVTGHGAGAVAAAARAIDPALRVVEQTEQLGTAHAVRQALPELAGFAGEVVVLYGDTPLIRLETLEAMLAARAAGAAVVVLGFEAADPDGYGRLVLDATGALAAIVEAREATPAELAIRLCNSGLLAADAATLADLLASVGNDNAKGEYYLTDVVALARARGLAAAAITCPEAETLGVNSRADLAAAEAAFQARARAEVMANGATLTDPASVFFALDTIIGRDVTIGPGVVFGPEVTVESGATILAFCHLEGCHVSRGARIGPFARLRPGAEIAEGARIGNFVEVKNAIVEEGAKANHLTYIGDAHVGRGANIGAGTIICNYDGVFKHRTAIGAGAFIGSNTALVAPVSVGARALVAAGSVVTADVPDGALAIARGRQETKPALGQRMMERLRALKAQGSADMCGIVAILGRHEVAPLILEALKRLEYRGYDSAGIATVHDGRLGRRRAVGKLIALSDLLVRDPIRGRAGIGHTRWATHGQPSERNAHPHQAGRVAVVHNGIIENFRALKIELEAEGADFETETDTEIVVQLCNRELEAGKTPVEAARATLARLQGAFALCFLFDGEDDLLVAARRGSPLAVGYGDGEVFVGSDALTLAPMTSRVAYLEEGDHAVLTRRSVEIFDALGSPASRDVHHVPVENFYAEKGPYKHFMAKEMHEQPTVIADALSRYLTPDRRAAALPAGINFTGVDRLVLVACGTAHYACHVARYWFERLARLPVEIEVASEFRYREPPLSGRTLGIFVSQSGETADTLAALRYVRGQGGRIVSVVNVETSTIARESDVALPILAGPEIGVASTKAFTCQLTVLATLALAAGRQRGTLAAAEEEQLATALGSVPGLVAQALAVEPEIAEIARELSRAQDVLFLGRGAMYPLALEGALKLKEISYIHAEGYASGELKHGPIALVDEDVPVIVLAPSDGLFDKTVSNMQEVMARDGKVLLLSDAAGLAQAGSGVWRAVGMPGCDPFVAPILYAAPVQLLAYHAAMFKGTDVDQPRNLAKSVTVE